MRETGQLPVVAVRAKVNVRDPAWGVVKSTQPITPAMAETIAKIDAVLAELGYRQVWQNDEFMILVR